MYHQIVTFEEFFDGFKKTYAAQLITAAEINFKYIQYVKGRLEDISNMAAESLKTADVSSRIMDKLGEKNEYKEFEIVKHATKYSDDTCRELVASRKFFERNEFLLDELENDPVGWGKGE